MKKIFFIIVALSVVTLRAQKKWSLEECISYALENNISINQLRVNADIQTQSIKANKGSLMPTLSSGASQQNNYFGSVSTRGDNFSTTLNFLDANWTVFNGFKNLNNYRKSLIDGEIASKNIEILSNDVALNIANTYLQVLLNKELLNVAKNQLELSKRQLDISKQQLKSGVTSEANVYDVEATVARDEQTLVQQENTLLSSLLLLRQQLQLPVEEPFDVAELLADKLLNKLEVKTPATVYQEAEKSRPEIEAAELGIESISKNLKIVLANYLPSLTLGYGYGATYSYIKGVQHDNFSKQLDDNIGHAITASLSIPIFTGFSNKTNVEIAKLNIENAELDLANEKFNLRQNIETAYLDVLNARKAYEASLKTLKSREISLDFTEKRFKTGTVNNFDFETSKNNFISSQSSVAQSKYDYIFKVKVLQFYAGNDFSLN
ncbi:TolC family protein [Zobellia russellii]|uniref:TolC family protein n=1 Tax=Zobellia russellii TaxID=248907 RepID=UPI0037DC2729